MRLLVVALAACAPSVRTPHVQPAPAPAPVTHSARLGVREILALSERRDLEAIDRVAHALVADPDPLVRRMAAMELERMVDASSSAVARGVAVSALEEASRERDPKIRAAATRSLVALQNARAPWSSVSTPPANPALLGLVGGGTLCSGSAPLMVVVTNATNQTGDLCAAVTRASAHVPWPVSNGGAFAVGVTLTGMQRSASGLRCSVSLATASPRGSVTRASGYATTATYSALAPRACVDDLIESLLTTQVVPMMRAAPSVPAPAPPAAAPAAAAAPRTP